MIDLHHLTFRVQAETNVHMGAQAGSQIRGTLWQALNAFACTDPSQQGNPQHSLHCPMCYLLELKQRSPRGQNPPRPFALRPPMAVRVEEDRVFSTGECFDIGFVLIGDAARLFPYICQGMQQAGQQGVGYGRGRFSLQDIINHNPLTDMSVSLYENGRVQLPSLPITSALVDEVAKTLSATQIRLRFLTPTQIKHRGKLLQVPQFGGLIGRILERCQALTYHYSDADASPDDWQPLYEHLTHLAESVRRVQDNTRVVQIWSGSRRSNRRHDLGGFVGEVLYEGNLAPFRNWLVWGSLLHVGKNTVKGDGWYQVA